MTALTASSEFSVFLPSRNSSSTSSGTEQSRQVRRSRGTSGILHREESKAATFVTVTAAVGDDQVAFNEREATVQQRLIALGQMYFDEYGIPMNSQSQEGLRCLMRYHVKLPTPLISAESTGLITTTWLVGSECLTLRFTDRHRIDYALTFRAADGKMRQTWGESSLATLFESVPNARRVALGA